MESATNPERIIDPAVHPSPHDPVHERVTSLPTPAAMGTLSDLYEAGWVYAPD